MSVVIVGPGALGCLLAASLADGTTAGVQLLDHNPARARQLRQRGITLQRLDGSTVRHHLEVATDPAIVQRAEIIILCVKSPAVPGTLAALRPYLDQNNLLVALQNGIGHLAPLTRHARGRNLALGVSALGANMASVDHVVHAGIGPSYLGLFTPPTHTASTALCRLAALLRDCAFPATVVADITPHLWGKLLINVGINALTAIHDCPNGTLVTDPQLRATMLAAVAEAAQVARAEKIPLSDDPLVRVQEVCQATATNISSMLQDIRRHRRTEIAAINGAVVDLAARHGIATPVNRQLIDTINQLESTR